MPGNRFASMIPFHKSLRGRLLLFVVAPTVMVMASVIIITASKTFDAVREQTESAMRHLADQVALEVERGNTRAVMAVEMMTLAQEEGMFGDRTTSANFARSVLEHYDEFTGSYFGYEPGADTDDAGFLAASKGLSITNALDENGRYLPYWFRDDTAEGAIALTPLVDMETSLYYQGNKDQFLAEHKALPMITEPYVYEGKMIVEQTYPIVRDGKFVGIAGVDRALKDIGLFLETIKSTYDVDVFLVSSRGRFIATTLGLGLRTKGVRETKYSELFGNLYDNRKTGLLKLQTDPVENEHYYYASAHIPTGDWMVVIREAEEDVIGPLKRHMYTTTTGALAGLVGVTVLALWFSSRTSRRIHLAMEAADRVASGDLSHQLTEEHQTNDEIGSMFRSFNRVVASYREVGEVCTAIAEGDFSRKVEKRSKNDSLADAINSMA